MDRDDIFRLLLIVLLMANRSLSGEESEKFDYSAINDFLILAMLFRPFSSADDDGDDTSSTFDR